MSNFMELYNEGKKPFVRIRNRKGVNRTTTSIILSFRWHEEKKVKSKDFSLVIVSAEDKEHEENELKKFKSTFLHHFNINTYVIKNNVRSYMKTDEMNEALGELLKEENISELYDKAYEGFMVAIWGKDWECNRNNYYKAKEELKAQEEQMLIDKRNECIKKCKGLDMLDDTVRAVIIDSLIATKLRMEHSYRYYRKDEEKLEAHLMLMDYINNEDKYKEEEEITF